ncbi:MAG: DUF2442 domain-containing protein [Flavobacteriaceae bacterium]|jgi:hypothetical protein|nr:DUF2442 domain-containing protein [Flavobacteriaceae bacterium]
MNPRVADVKPEKNYTLHIWFEEGIFDVKPYLDFEMFEPLKDIDFFNSVRPMHGTIQWANEADFCPDTVYLESVKTK